MKNSTYTQYDSWSLANRIFHWVNVVSIFGLIIFGLLMLYKKELGLLGLDTKIGLKVIHVIIGYVFVTNLVIRILLGFIGPESARFSKFFPGKGFVGDLKDYLQSVKSGTPNQYIGHNPMGKLAVSLMMLLMIMMAVTGLIRAGTDIYYPPFGSYFAQSVVADGADYQMLKPYDKTGADEKKMAELKSFKKPYGKVHIYTAFTLMFVIFLHIVFVMRAENSQGGGFVSGIFSGKKLLSKNPQDK